MLRFFRKPAAAVAAEDELTPLEIEALLKRGDAAAQGFMIAPILRREPARRFKSRRIAPSAMFYSAGRGARRLIVGFTGRRLRLMAPVSVFLQHIDDGAFDALVCNDATDAHYDAGAAGFATSLPGMAEAIAALARRGGYRDIVTFGTSSGGLPALRVGRMLGASRAVSFGGRFPWHIGRIAGRRVTIGAFDALCPCCASQTPCVALHSEQNADDLADARLLAARLSGCEPIGLPFASHNLSHEFFRRGQLGALYSELFDPARAPNPDRIQALAREPVPA